MKALVMILLLGIKAYPSLNPLRSTQKASSTSDPDSKRTSPGNANIKGFTLILTVKGLMQGSSAHLEFLESAIPVSSLISLIAVSKQSVSLFSILPPGNPMSQRKGSSGSGLLFIISTSHPFMIMPIAASHSIYPFKLLESDDKNVQAKGVAPWAS